MARCVEKLPHDKCGSSDALQVFEDKGKYTGYCFNCDTYVPSPYGDRKQEEKASPISSPEDVAEQLYDIGKLPVLERSDRVLRQDTLDWFGVRTSVSEQDGVSPIVSYFPFHNDVGETTSYKAKLIPAKEMWTVGEFKGKRNLFGWSQALSTGARVLYITEGEEDACALYQALSSHQITAAAIDVTEVEPIPQNDPLLTLDNIIITPHIASASVATRTKMAIMAATNLIAGLRGEVPPNCVNPEALTR